MQRIVIEYDEANGSLKVQAPDNMVLVLGLIEYFREMVLTQKIRPGLAQRVVVPEVVPPSSQLAQ